MDALIKEYWQQISAAALVMVWGVRVEANGKAERRERMAADNRIEQSVRTAHEQNKEQMVGVKEAIESMAKEQSETVKSLHKVELTLTEIAAYEKGRTDERAKRGHDD
jgi:hypothetical protein